MHARTMGISMPNGTDRTNSATETTFRWEGRPVARYGQYSTGSCGSWYRRQWRNAQKYPPYQTCHPASSGGTGRQTGRILRVLAAIARARKLNWRRVYRRSSRAKKGPCGRPTKRQGTKILAICTDHSLPLAVGYQSASPHESRWSKNPRESFLENFPND